MSTNRAIADLDEIEVEFDGPIEVVELPGAVAPATTPTESGTFDVDSIPRMYDENPDVEDPSTATNDTLMQFAKLSNGKTLPRIVRAPRPGEPLEARAQHLLGYIDGRTPLGVIFESAGVDEGEAILILAQLVDLGIVAVR
jgi:hypothetical protein